MEKEKRSRKESIYLILNLVLAVITIAVVAALLSNVISEDVNNTSLLLGFTILIQVLFQGLLFIVKDDKTDKIRSLVVGILYIIAMIMAFMANTEHYMLFYLANSTILVALAVNQFMLIRKKNSKKGIVSNSLLGGTLVLLAILTLIDTSAQDAIFCNVIAAVFFLVIAFKNILFPTLKFEKVKLLLDILVKTHTVDILVCLCTFMVAFSFILPKFEASINDFWEGMWYCFTVVTTIGFGDMVAVTRAGRLLTVVLGIYGIVVVAILTSVIVNFYNEVSAKEKAKDVIE